MDEIREAAEISVARGCGFATLAILTALIGLWNAPHLAFQTAAALFMLMSAILLFKAERALNKPYQRTELWLMIGDRITLTPELRQKAFGEARKDALLRYAKYSAGFMGLSVIIALFI